MALESAIDGIVEYSLSNANKLRVAATAALAVAAQKPKRVGRSAKQFFMRGLEWGLSVIGFGQTPPPDPDPDPPPPIVDTIQGPGSNPLKNILRIINDSGEEIIFHLRFHP